MEKMFFYFGFSCKTNNKNNRLALVFFQSMALTANRMRGSVIYLTQYGCTTRDGAKDTRGLCRNLYFAMLPLRKIRLILIRLQTYTPKRCLMLPLVRFRLFFRCHHPSKSGRVRKIKKRQKLIIPFLILLL